MGSILYYSNFCKHSEKLLQSVSKSSINKDIHFICIDKRVKERDGKMYIVLENGQKIIMPENVAKVPALLLLNEGCRVLYGDAIYTHLKPAQEAVTRQATHNNMEPSAFSLGGYGGSGGFGGSGVVSDNFSFLDMDAESLNAKGDGGMRQMHNYMSLQCNDNQSISTPNDEHDYKQGKNPEGAGSTIEQLQRQRDQDMQSIHKTQTRM